MSTWKGKTRGGLTGYRIFLFLLENFNIKAAYFLLYYVAMYYVLFAGKARKPMFFYFKKIHGFNTLKSWFYLYRNNITFGKTIIDKVVLMAGFPNRFSFELIGEQYIRQMADANGGLIIGAHIGNWEIAGHMLQRIDKTVHIVMIDAEYQKIKKLLDNVMTEKKMNIIHISDDMSHLYKIKEALQANEIVAIHGDRFLPGSKVMRCNFMGKMADFPTGPFYIAMKYNKPVTYVSAIKVDNNHYRLTATKPVLYSNSGKLEIRKNTLRKMLTDYICQLETTLNRHPEQWFNYYYFWGKYNNDYE